MKCFATSYLLHFERCFCFATAPHSDTRAVSAGDKLAAAINGRGRRGVNVYTALTGDASSFCCAARQVLSLLFRQICLNLRFLYKTCNSPNFCKLHSRKSYQTRFALPLLVFVKMALFEIHLWCFIFFSSIYFLHNYFCVKQWQVGSRKTFCCRDKLVHLQLFKVQIQADRPAVYASGAVCTL